MAQKETKKETKKADLPRSKAGRYLEGVGRRKTATARVRLWLASPKTERKFLVNEKSVEEYFRDPELQRVAKECLEKAGTEDSFSVKVLTRIALAGRSHPSRHSQSLG
ncbi:MAG: 30S ribosomal protein S9 [Parcubacteria group bacterium]|nr:30S ribosomal protein S9 [Parcubacteria group bacterium]